MDALTAIETRVSANKLGDPGPTPDQIETILHMAARAPDHGRLSPWRFVVIEGESRHILGKAMADIARRNKPDATEADLERETGKAMRAPTIIAVAARTANPERIPEIEQIVAVGAAVQNMFLTAHALGLGAMWKTGAAAYDGGVKSTLGLLQTDHIVGFLYLGAPLVFAPPKRETAISYTRL
jgi:nitroreductase